MSFGLQSAGRVDGYLAADIGFTLFPGLACLPVVKEAEAFGGNQAGDTEAVVQLTEVYIVRFHPGHFVGPLRRYLPCPDSGEIIALIAERAG